ncbi:ketopantoate reductase family protein [Dactylosporangium vinaceum]|uniref:Ketopantoate reductase family protein n=1 Tax=Dactylosporangium vinaceum TaxID=53362 RepID=A0ABV5M2V3_9ACTN|nr:2-dehydropantoate 2-reductase N-terminal domain-containing protein [Dactylosporangium vinaceum]UAB99863.1 ketopantoate reductase family protein [Dactylosporangium vinaceum]
MSRYVVIGGGAVGGLFAAQLTLAGIPAILVARGRHLEAIRASGLRIRRPHGDDVVRLATAAGPAEVRLTPQDVLVLATKAQDAEAALTAWAWQPVHAEPGAPTGLGADLPVLTVQNGLATEDAALRRFARVYGVTVAVAASYLTPGEVVNPSYPVNGALWLGRYPDRADPAAAQFARDWTAAGFAVHSVPDITAWKARKLFVSVRNGLDLLDGNDEGKARAGALLVAEAEAVLAAAGIVPAPPEALRAGATLTFEPVPGHVPGRLSTWQSFARGAGSEVDHLNGEIVRLGRRHGVATPVNERLQRLLGAQAAAGRPPGTHTVDELLAVLADLRG